MTLHLTFFLIHKRFLTNFDLKFASQTVSEWQKPAHIKSGGRIMPATRSPTYWIVTTVFLASTAGYFASKQTQVMTITLVPSAFAKAPPSLHAQSTSTQAPPSNQTVTEQPNCKKSRTQIEINACTKLSAASADKKLNQVYQQLRAQIEDLQQKKLLINAQLAWIKFRDANCEFEKSRFAGGTIAPSIYFSCIEQVTKQRTKELEEDYSRLRKENTL